MQTVSRGQIMPHVKLTCVKTDKFKTGFLAVDLLIGLTKNEAAKNALLPKVLRRGTVRHPDMESIAAALDELYGARIEPVVHKKGELQCVGFYADFIDDKYVPDGKSVLFSVAALLGEMLLLPSTQGGRLKGEYVESEKEKLIDEIRADINDKRQYSINRLVEQMCAKEAFGIRRLGTEDRVLKITAGELTKQYKKLISSADVEIFYCGSASEEVVTQAIIAAFGSMPRGNFNDVLATEVKFEPVSEEPRYFTDELDVKQGKLALGFRLGETMKSPNYAALQVFNAVYGGAVTSKLFLNVREKLSLCYFASSMIEKHKGIMIVSSGIEFEKYDEALGEILYQLDEMKNGNIADWELDGAKSAVITSLKAAADSPARLRGFYLDQAISDVSCAPEEMAALAAEITVEQVQKIAAGIKLDAVYFLKGNGSE